MTLADKLRALAVEADALEAKPTQGAPDPAALALWLQPAPHPEETAEQHAARLRDRDANLARYEQALADAYFPGMFGVETLTTADMVYLDAMAVPYFTKTGRDIMRDGIISGKNLHLSQVRKNGDALRGTVDLSAYSSPLKAEVERRMA